MTRCFVGVGEAAYGPVAPTIISDLYPVQVRGYVLLGSTWPFRSAVPWATCSAAWSTASPTTGAGRFTWWSRPGLLLGLWCFLMPNPARGQADIGEESRSARWADYLVLLRTPSYVLDTLGMTAMTFALGGIAFWMPRYIVAQHKELGLGSINVIFGGIVVVSGLGATLLGGIVGDWLRPRWPGSYFIVSGIAMLVGFPFVLLILVTPFPWAWAFVFLACFCLFFNTGPTNTVLANVTHPAVRASAFALNILVIHALGDAISPWVIGTIAGSYNLATGFTVVSIFILIGGIFWLWGARYLERDTALAPTRLAETNNAAGA